MRQHPPAVNLNKPLACLGCSFGDGSAERIRLVARRIKIAPLDRFSSGSNCGHWTDPLHSNQIELNSTEWQS